MKLQVLGKNQTVLTITDHTGACVQQLFFSYQTLVAAWSEASGYLRTSTRHSQTTDTHINRWLGQCHAENVTYVPQNQLDLLIA